jgi:NitT/TauT family transport system permease protein
MTNIREPSGSVTLKPLLTVRGQNSPRIRNILGILAILCVLFLWTFASKAHLVNPFYLPSPLYIVRNLPELTHRYYLPGEITITLWRMIQAMVLTIVVAVPLGVLMGSLPLFDSFLGRLVDGLKSVPPTAFLGLMIAWWGIEERGKVMFLFVGALFYMILLCKNAVMNVREEYLMVARDFGANTIQMIIRVLIPGALPEIWNAVIVCNGLMWTYIVLAEFNNAQYGLGFMLQQTAHQARPDLVFPIIIMIAIISTLTDWILRSIPKQLFSWWPQ